MAQGDIHLHYGCFYNLTNKTFMVGRIGTQGPNVGTQAPSIDTSTSFEAGVVITIKLKDGAAYGALEQFLNNYMRTNPHEPLSVPTKYLKTEVLSKTMKVEKEMLVSQYKELSLDYIEKMRHLANRALRDCNLDVSLVIEAIDNISLERSYPDDWYDIVTRQVGSFEIRCLLDGDFCQRFIKTGGYNLFGDFEMHA